MRTCVKFGVIERQTKFLERAVKLGEFFGDFFECSHIWAQNGESYFGKVLKRLERQEEDENCKCRICDVEIVNGPEG